MADPRMPLQPRPICNGSGFCVCVCVRAKEEEKKGRAEDLKGGRFIEQPYVEGRPYVLS